MELERVEMLLDLMSADCQNYVVTIESIHLMLATSMKKVEDLEVSLNAAAHTPDASVSSEADLMIKSLQLERDILQGEIADLEARFVDSSPESATKLLTDSFVM